MHNISLYIIFPSFPSFLVCVTGYPAIVNGPINMIFDRMMGFNLNLLIFGKSRSKVKGQGQISMKICIFWVNFGHSSYV